MVKNLKVVLVFSLIVSLFIASCSKDLEPALPSEPDNIESITPEEPNTPEEKPSTPEEKPSNPTQDPNAFEMGTGSGSLIIDGSNATVGGKSLIVIKAGSYNNITIKNLKGSVSSPVVIKNGGQIFIKNEMEVSNVTNVIVSGDNDSSTPYGFNFHNIGFRAVYLGAKINGLTLKNMSFKNVKDYAFHSTMENTAYDGTINTRTEGLKILNSRFDNAGSVAIGGGFDKSKDLGFVNNVEIAHNIFENSSAGAAVIFANVQNYNVHHNTVNNYNTNNNNHNGVFFMKGAGKFHDNKFTNFQGNMIRAWVFARVSDPVTVEIYNNIGYNTRKYGAFELQGFDYYMVPGKTIPANAKVYNNTAGRMNTSKDWQGLMLDVYNYGGTLEYYNNLGFDMHDTRGPVKNDMLNDMSNVKIIKNTNNKYVSSASEAVNDVNSLISKHPGLGAK